MHLTVDVFKHSIAFRHGYFAWLCAIIQGYLNVEKGCKAALCAPEQGPEGAASQTSAEEALFKQI